MVDATGAGRQVPRIGRPAVPRRHLWAVWRSKANREADVAPAKAPMNFDHPRLALGVLEALGARAAVIAADGRVLSSTRSFDRFGDHVVGGWPGQGDGGGFLRRRLVKALAALEHAAEAGPATIPVAADGDRPPLVLDVIRISHWSKGNLRQHLGLVVVTPVVQARCLASESMLQDLFGMTPAEARVARGIADGESIATLAGTVKSSRETIRFHLKSVFAKTGTSRQSELVGLLAGSLLRRAGNPSGA